MCYIHTIDYYSAMKRNEIPKQCTRWINLENIMEARPKRPHSIGFYLYEMSRIGKFIEIENRFVVSREER